MNNGLQIGTDVELARLIAGFAIALFLLFIAGLLVMVSAHWRQR